MSDAYKKAGVDIDAGERLVEAISPLARTTARAGADAALGGFGERLARAGSRPLEIMTLTPYG